MTNIQDVKKYDYTHTNEQRIQKIKSVFEQVKKLKHAIRYHYGSDHKVMFIFDPLLEETKEAERSINSIKDQLELHNLLDKL